MLRRFVMNNQPAIAAKSLTKTFGENQAVKGVSFQVNPGEIFSLLGPNGAGKTTTMRMLSCLAQPDGGEAWIMGHSIRSDPMGVKATIGVVPQDIALYTDLSAYENLSFWGRMYGLHGKILHQRIQEVLEITGLADRQKGPVGKFSGGMKRRLNLGIALLHRPQVVIMDEPTVGIDPQSRRGILDGIQEHNRQGMTVLYTTHYMEEAQEISDHIAVMDLGQIIACGTQAELVKIVGEMSRVDLVLNSEAGRVLEPWQGIEGVSQAFSEDGKLTLLVEDSDLVLPRLFEAASHCGVRITAAEIKEPNLEAVFLHLTGKALRN
jgi:ABC-2 type transport system ATP-binding protein